MISTIKGFFAVYVQEHADEDADIQIKVACAALLLEIAKADFSVDTTELLSIRSILNKTLSLSAGQLDSLIILAEKKSTGSTSLHEFTNVIHREYSLDQKIELFDQLWRVAYADGKLDKYEEYLLRKISDLIYLPHKHYIQSKHRILLERASGQA